MKLNEILNESVEPSEVMRSLKGVLRRSPLSAYAEWRNESDTELSVRHFGDWETDKDNYHDRQDDGDDDWEVPTEKTKRILKSLIDDVEAGYPGVKVNVTVGEKNWLYFEIV